MHKKEFKRDSNNYREISMTSTMSRLYERILKDLNEKEYSYLGEAENPEYSEMENTV